MNKLITFAGIAALAAADLDSLVQKEEDAEGEFADIFRLILEEIRML